MDPQKGSAALEYVLVTTCASILALALMGIAAKITKSKLAEISSRSEVEQLELNGLEFLDGR